MDTGRTIAKSAERTFIAWEGGDQVSGIHDQYANLTPRQQLVLAWEAIQGGSYEKARAARLLPERMTSVDWDSKGFATLKVVKPADFFDPAGGASGSTVTGKGIVPILAMDSIMEGAMPFVCARECIPILDMKSETVTMPFFSARKYITPINAPASDALDLLQDVGQATLKAKRYSVQATIGKELLRDATVDILAKTLVEMGATHEMTLNQNVFSKLAMFNSGTAINLWSATSPAAAKGLIGAKAQVDAAGFMAQTAVIWPVLWNDLMGTLLPAYNIVAQQQLMGVGVPQNAVSRKMGATNAIIYAGLKICETGVALDTSIDSTHTIGTTAGNVGGMVFDGERVGILGIRQELEVEEFDDIIKYATRPIAHMRWAFATALDPNNANVTNAAANCICTHA